jgi:hypothetical protein
MPKVIEEERKTPNQHSTNIALQTNKSADLTGVRLIEQAFADYLLQLQNIWAEAQKLSEEAYAKYLKEVEEIYCTGAKRVEGLYRSYLSSVEKIAAAEDQESIAETEYTALMHKGKGVWTPADNSKLFDAYCRYSRESHAVWSAENLRGRFEKAYRGYLAAVQKGWDAMEVSRVSPAKLVAIGESIRTAACWAGATLG